MVQYPYKETICIRKDETLKVTWHEKSYYIMAVNDKPTTTPKSYQEFIPSLLSNGWRIKI